MIKIPNRPKKPVTPETEPLAVSRSEAARLIGVSLVTLDRLARSGELQPKRIGSRRVVYPMSALKAYLETPSSEE